MAWTSLVVYEPGTGVLRTLSSTDGAASARRKSLMVCVPGTGVLRSAALLSMLEAASSAARTSLVEYVPGTGVLCCVAELSIVGVISGFCSASEPASGTSSIGLAEARDFSREGLIGGGVGCFTAGVATAG